MKQFELQIPISQLFNALTANILQVNLFQIGCSEQLNKTHNFRKIIFVTSSLWNSIVSVDLRSMFEFVTSSHP